MYDTVVCPKHQTWRLLKISRHDIWQDISCLVDILPDTIKIRVSSIENDVHVFIKLPNSTAEVELTPDKVILFNDLGEAKVVSYEFANCNYVNTHADMTRVEIDREWDDLRQIAQLCSCPTCHAKTLKPSPKTDLSGHYNLLKCELCKRIVTRLECMDMEARVNEEFTRRSVELNRRMKERYLKEMNHDG